jgi:hypothetical protein
MAPPDGGIRARIVPRAIATQKCQNMATTFQQEDFAMLIKTSIALATARTLGMAAAALAAPDTDQKGGYREKDPAGS